MSDTQPSSVNQRRTSSSEFPPGAALPPRALDRRQMLQVMAASLGLAGVTSCRRPEHRIVPYQSAPEGILPGQPRVYATTITRAGEACGILARSVDGRPVKIEGNQLHPASLGGASAWMQASILELYDPDRSQRAMRRSSTDAAWEASDWEAFQAQWEEWAREWDSSGGSGLAFLTGASCSPTENRLRRQLRKRFSQAEWVVYEPVDDTNIFRGFATVLGVPARPLYRFDQARAVLAIECDLLLTETDAVANSRGFARFRDNRKPAGHGGRLYVVESGLSLTGANADHRLALPPSRIPSLVAALAREFRSAGLDLPDPGETELETSDRLREVARELLSAGPAALIVGGRGLPPELHAWLLAFNRALGALGRTIELLPVDHLEWGGSAEIVDLAERIREGLISALVVTGSNPAYTAPGGIPFGELMARVDRCIHLGLHLDETGERARWHLPESHFLESWGDAVWTDGTPSIVQPLIAPLFDSRSRVEFWSLLAGDAASGYGAVRDTWLEQMLGEEEFESRWNQVLRDGLLERQAKAVAPPAEMVDLPVLAAGSPPAPQRLELVLRASPKIFDGRHANNGWLQELPDPLSKIAWDNAALVSPATAREFALDDGALVRLSHGERQLEVPIFVLPHHADGCLSLSLGYGRRKAGRVGTGVGSNAYPLRDPGRPYWNRAVELSKTGQRYHFALTQEHWRMEGRHIFRSTRRSDSRDPASHFSVEEAPQADLFQRRPAGEGPQWGMAIDLNRCTGCQACAVACQSENNIPIVGREQVRRGREMHWIRVDRYFLGSTGLAFQPVPCMHCENAPCEQVCPVGATVHDSEGLNAMVYNRCIGTRYCSNNCPYKVRRFNFFNYTNELPELVQMAMNPDVTVRSRGVMEKCTYCVQRIRRAEREARLENRPPGDSAVTTACQQTCPAQAISFGNLTDPSSQVSQWKSDPRNYVLLPELNHRPRTSYLAAIDNPSEEWSDV